MPKSKETFKNLFLALIILLLVMPFITTFNEFLTAWFLRFGWYRGIESIVVPFEVRSVVGTLHFLQIQAVGSNTTLSFVKDGDWQRIWIAWNCVGWQSLIVLIMTLVTGLQGGFSKLSKLQVVLVGVLGIFLVNIARISLVVIIFKYIGYLPAVIFHDYFANLAMVAWLFFFWWFSYKFILEETAI
jgi:exosortase/archaeosortase family protein